MQRIFYAVIITAALGLGSGPAAAEKRIALLIGNQDYKPGVGRLKNTLNDIATVGAALKAVGFEIGTPVKNANRAEMLLAINDFAARLKQAGPDAVGFLYYSGHGVASSGENYLIPVDTTKPSTRLLRVQGVKQQEILSILRTEAPYAAHYVVLDACRNALQGIRGGKGFVPARQESGMLIAYAAAPGSTASDAGSSSGPYAATLAEQIVKPGQNDLLMFHNVRVAVSTATGGDQVPWIEDGIQRRVRFRFGGGSEPQAVQPADTARPPLSEVARVWAEVKESNDRAVLDAFAKQYSGTVQAQLARTRLKELLPTAVAVRPSTSRSIGGKWKTDGEDERISFPNVSDGSVVGSYTPNEGRIVGRLKNGHLTGIWVERFSRESCKTEKEGSKYWGKLAFTFNPDVTKFSGSWGYCDDAPSISWSGRKIQ